MEYDDDLDELQNYTAWELFRTFIKVLLCDVWHFVKPRRLYKKLRPLSEIGIAELRQNGIDQIKLEAARKLGGDPSDYIVRPFSPSDLKDARL